MMQDSDRSEDPMDAEPTAAAGFDTPWSTSSIAALVEAGTRVGRYTILGEIGRGGMGVVLAAYDPQLDRRIALKLVRPDPFGDEEPEGARNRLLREAQALARLSHPNVVTVHDAGVWEGRVFIAMDFIDGRDARRWVAEERPALRELLATLVAAGRGLVAAHEAGLLHRDFKPENIMIDGSGRVRVVDFGLAKPFETLVVGSPLEASELTAEETGSSGSQGVLHTPLTRESVIIGTPSYLPPEVVRGDLVDARADQFAFCATLYELVYDRLPYGTEGILDLARRIDTEHYEPPAPQAPCGRVPTSVRQALVRGLRSDPDERFGSLADLLAVLERDPEAVRRSWLLVAATVLLVGAGLWFGMRAADQRSTLCLGGPAKLAEVWNDDSRQAVHASFDRIERPWAQGYAAQVTEYLDAYALQWQSSYQEACAATHLRGEQSEQLLDLRMACLEQRRQELSTFAGVLAVADLATLTASREVAAGLSALAPCSDVEALRATEPVPPGEDARRVVESVRADLAQVAVLQRLPRPAAAREIAARAEQAAAELGWPPLQAEALVAAGSLADTLGDYEEARDKLFAAMVEAETGHHDQAMLEAYEALAAVESLRTQDVAHSRQWLLLGRAILSRGTFPRENEHRLNVVEGTLEYALGHFGEAAELWRRELDWRIANHGDADPRSLELRNKLAGALESLGSYDEALAVAREHQRVIEAELGPDAPELAYSWLNQGNALFRLRKFEAALHAYERAHVLLAESLGTGHPHVVMVLNNEAAVLRELGRNAEALPLLEEVLESWRVTYGDTPNSDISMSYGNLAQVHMTLGHDEEARRCAQQAVAIDRAALGENHIATAGSLSILAEIYLGTGQPERAIEPMEAAFHIAESFDVGTELLGEARFFLARAYWDSGRDRAHALALARRASAEFAAAGDAFAEQRRQVDEWVAERSR